MPIEQAPAGDDQPRPPVPGQRDRRMQAVPHKRCGNPNLNLSPRCGARTRAGCPCRAPAIRGKLRCRMHGGRSTGPRTAEGLARLRAARTIHGRYSAEARAQNRYLLTYIRRSRVFWAAARCKYRLPPDLQARLRQAPPELLLPRQPTGGLTPAEDRAIMRAEAEALAPWKQAIALIRRSSRRVRPSPTGAATVRAPQMAEAHAPEAAVGRLHGAATMPADAMAKPHAPGAQAGLAEPPGAAVTPPGDSAAEPHAPEGVADSGDRARRAPRLSSWPGLIRPATSGDRPRPAPGDPIGDAWMAGSGLAMTRAGGSQSAVALAAAAEAAARAHAPEAQAARHVGARSGAAAAIAAQGRKPHAPVTAAPAAPRTDNAAIRRAAAQWRAKQRILGRS